MTLNTRMRFYKAAVLEYYPGAKLLERHGRYGIFNAEDCISRWYFNNPELAWKAAHEHIVSTILVSALESL